MLVWLVMLAQADDLVTRARQVLSVIPRCADEDRGDDVVVCGRRRADRFRAPLVVHDAGDPQHEGVPAERERWLARTNPVHDLSPFLVGGGMAGVHMVTGGSGTSVAGLRPLAP